LAYNAPAGSTTQRPALESAASCGDCRRQGRQTTSGDNPLNPFLFQPELLVLTLRHRYLAWGALAHLVLNVPASPEVQEKVLEALPNLRSLFLGRNDDWMVSSGKKHQRKEHQKAYGNLPKADNRHSAVMCEQHL
jgi:hypothetical protein